MPYSAGESFHRDVVERLRNYALFVSYLRPLVESGAVVLVSTNLLGADLTTELLSAEGRVVEEVVDRGDLLDLAAEVEGLQGTAAAERIAEQRDVFERVVRHGAHDIMLSAELSAHHGSSLDLYLPFRYHRHLLQLLSSDPAVATAWTTYLQQGRKALPWTGNWPRARADEAAVLAELANVGVTDLTLTAKDLITVRPGDEFAAWRHDLRTARLEVPTLRSRDLLTTGTAAEVVGERLRDGSDQLQAKIRKSRLWRGRRAAASRSSSVR
ncbi:hypothetical protein JIG36_33545 [Actinoplanes sp. LDG1-06]|uniref:Uncharacterized protein n=1 Tax=Paractinoplanes ovalisporus TaxID=2810368 RepID=A0ABS2AKW9_9ACTN|nr:hypothetical protein [Actinoplanes ovalisporus]MBM2620446.1 hypothetical protein [Actinoplanes ovalisporus]